MVEITNDVVASGSITASSAVVNGVNVESSLTLIQSSLDGKQNTLEAGTGIDITKNVISSTSSSSFVGFRAVTAQGADLNISINTIIPFNSVSVNTLPMILKICLTQLLRLTPSLRDIVVIWVFEPFYSGI